jgi:uncharacterized surface anchored protein
MAAAPLDTVGTSYWSWSDASHTTLVATNYTIEIEVHKTMTAMDYQVETTTEGATFELYAVASDGTQKLVATKTVASNGANVVFDDLTVGSYALVETVAPAGYAITSTKYFSIDDTGNVILAADTDPASVTNGEAPVIEVVDEPISFTVLKVDENGEGLEGTALSIEALPGSSFLTAPEPEQATEPAAGESAEVTEPGEDNESTEPDESTEPAEGEGEGDDATEPDDAEQPASQPSYTWTTGANGTVTFDGLLAGNSYKVTEVASVAGYELSSSVLYVYVNLDGTVSLSTDDATEPDAAEQPENTWKVLDIPGTTDDDVSYSAVLNNSLVRLELVKQLNGEDIDVLANIDPSSAIFSIAPAQGCTFADGTTDEVEVTLENAAQTLTNLVVGSNYVLTETHAPDGYASSGSVTLHVEDDGTFSFADDAEHAGWAISGDTVTVTDEPVLVKVTKHGDYVEPSDETEPAAIDEAAVFDAAEYEVTGVFADDATAEQTKAFIDADGDTTVTIDGLIVGNSYTLTETTAPAGYEVEPTAFVFTVNSDGSIAPEAAQTRSNGDGWYYNGFDQAEGCAMVDLYDEPIQVTLMKYATSFTFDLRSATTLPGTQIALAGTFVDLQTGELVNDVRVYVMGEEPVTIEGLVGTYDYMMWELSSVDGYNKNAGAVTLHVTKSGELEVVDGDDTEMCAKSSVDEDAIVVLDTRTYLQIIKIDAATEEALEGAEFQVTQVELQNGAYVAVEGGLDETVTTDDEGMLMLSGQMIVGKTYMVVETAAPAGYYCNGEPFYFKYQEGGAIEEVEVNGSNSAYHIELAEDGEHGYMAALVVDDEATGFSVVKYGADDSEHTTMLAGAEFELKPADGFAFADGSKDAVRFATTAEGGMALLSGSGSAGEELVPSGLLVVGSTYVLSETKAPEGYELATGSFAFTLDDAGVVTEVEGAEGAGQAQGTYQAQGGTIVVVDELTPEPEQPATTPTTTSEQVAKTADDTAEWPAALGAFGGLLALSGCALLVRRRRDADDAGTAADDADTAA